MTDAPGAGTATNVPMSQNHDNHVRKNNNTTNIIPTDVDAMQNLSTHGSSLPASQLNGCLLLCVQCGTA